MTDADLDHMARELLYEIARLWSLSQGQQMRLAAKPELVMCAKGFLARAALMQQPKPAANH